MPRRVQRRTSRPEGIRLVTTKNRIRIVGIALVAAGVVMAGAGLLYGMPQATDGLASAQAMYEAQGVSLTYNEQGQLIDRGTPEGAANIMKLLEDDWKFPVNDANFDPADPIVNTRDELMFQYATITYHVLHGVVKVTLTAEQVPITYRGVTYTEAGTYDIAPEGYYAEFDRTNPIEAQLRGAWTPQALALTAALAGGHANQAAGELAFATTLAIAGIGGLFALSGAGLVWVSFGREVALSRGSPRSASVVSSVLRK